MSTKKSVTALKGLVHKPTSRVSIKMMNEAIATHGGKKDQQIVEAKPSYKRTDLLAQCDPNGDISDDIKLWMTMNPVGKEKL